MKKLEWFFKMKIVRMSLIYRENAV